MFSNNSEFCTIGELAGKCSVTVRTLQYYDKCGLLTPRLTEGGRRIYDWQSVIRLQQILFLKSFGFSLEEIRDRLLPAESASELEGILVRQNEVLQVQISQLQKLAGLMDKAISEIRSGREIGIDKFVTIMQLIRMGNPQAFILRYFDNQQVKDMLNKPSTVSFNQRYEELCAKMLALFEQGAKPEDAEGQDLAAGWWHMVTAFSGGDPDLLKSMLSAGSDIDNWPGELDHLKRPMKEFLGPALALYWRNNGIKSEVE